MTPGNEFFASLVLAGIGGRTIAECKKNLTAQELRFWLAYFKQYGDPSPPAIVDIAAALIAYNVASGIPRERGQPRPRFEEFLVRTKRPREISLSDAMNTWK